MNIGDVASQRTVPPRGRPLVRP